jgi:hypothetical protein
MNIDNLPNSFRINEGPDHFLWRRQAEELQKLVERAAELLRSARPRTGITTYVEAATIASNEKVWIDWGKWAMERDQWLRDAGMEEK